MNTNHTIKRLEAMENFLADIIGKLESHSEVTFMLGFTNDIPTGTEFERGTLYAQCRLGMQIASDCLRKIKGRINNELQDIREKEEVKLF